METIGRSDFMLPTLLQTLMAGTHLAEKFPRWLIFQNQMRHNSS